MYKDCPSRALMTTVGMAAMLAAGSAHSAEAPARPDAAKPGELQEVIVTAERFSSSVQRTPAAITAITGDSIVAQGIHSVLGLNGVVPMAQFVENGQNVKVFIRGIGQQFDGDNTDPGVAVYMDQVYTPRSSLTTSLFDVKRVEVLPGPQGTLYGRNSAGGAVNVLTNTPTHEREFSATLEGGNYDLAHAAIAANLPVSERIQLRGALNLQKHDGYYKNGTADEETVAARLTVAIQPTDDLSILLRNEYSHAGGRGYGATDIPYVKPSDPWFAVNLPGVHPFRRLTVVKESAEVTYRFGDYSLTYIPAFVYYKDNSLGAIQLPTSFTDQYLALESQKQYTQELRLSQVSDHLKWTAGLFQYATRANNRGRTFFIPATSPTLILGDGPAKTDTDSYAVFGQATYSITDSLRVTGGLRYTWDRRKVNGVTSFYSAFAGFPCNLQGVCVTPYAEKGRWERFDWKLGADYDLADGHMVYANIQTGYVGGGANAVPATASSGLFKPEHVLAFTVGTKNRFFGNRLEVNNEAFYYIYSDLQLNAFDVTTGTTPIYNAKRSVIYGDQLQVVFAIDAATRVRAEVGVISARIDKALLPPPSAGAGVGLINYKDYELPNVASVSASLSLQHSWSLRNGGEIEGQVDSRFEGPVWSTYFHAPATRVASYTMTGASLTYVPPGHQWSFGLWVKNIENTAHLTGRAVTGVPGVAAGYLEPPRTFGVRMTLDL